ncbi:MAG: insulinase family protein [Chitinophagaceae bacterium]|nr:MAG: insulinase family protein [Chitinophagaceae bacterium]
MTYTYKFRWLVLFVTIIPFALFAQNEPYDMMVNGVKVIVKPSGNEIVVLQTFIKGGVRNYPAEKTGIESLAITALTECGTKNDDKNSFKNKLDKVSAYVTGQAGLDYSSLKLNCIKTDLDNVWPLYRDALLTPRFDDKEFARIKQDAVTAIRDAESNPDRALSKLAKQTAFAGRAYAKDPMGTVGIVSKLTAAETAKYWKSVFTKNKLVIVVVGQLDSILIKTMVADITGAIPAGPAFVREREVYAPKGNTFMPMARENATNYIMGVASGPLPGTSEYNAYALASTIFSQRHFIEIRTNHGLSYAPWAWFTNNLTPYMEICVSTTDPDKYIAIARNLIDRIQKDGFTEAELKNERTGYLTSIHYRNETNEAQATSFGTNEIIHGNWRRSIMINDEIKKITLDQLNEVFRKYLTNITWVYQGDTKKVTPALFTQKQTPALPGVKKAF